MTPAPDIVARPDIVTRLERLPLTPLHVAAAVLCGAGLIIDVAELSLNGVLSTIMSAPDSPLEPMEVTWLLASVFVGGAFGAPLLGWISDRFGRRLTLQISLLLVAGPSIGAALSNDGGWLIAFRFLSGMALGGYPPLITAYFADVMPPRWRARIGLSTVAFGLTGWPLVALLTAYLHALQPLGIEGWRWSLCLGGALSLVIAAALSIIPESPRQLMVRGHAQKADAACRRFERSAGITSPQDAASPAMPCHPAAADWYRAIGSYWRRFILVTAIYLMRPWATVGFPIVSGAIMVSKGQPVGDTLMSIGIGGFGFAAGALIAAQVVDRVERKTALLAVSIGMMIAGAVFAWQNDLAVMIVAMTAFNFLAAVYGPVLSLYASEMFPTDIRASATATAWAANRLGSALAPFVLLPALHALGAIATFLTVAASLLINMVLIVAYGPERKGGVPVEETVR